jgi:hypothetical protein
VERVRGNVRHRLDGGLHLVVVYVEDDIRLPLLAHIDRVPQATEPRSQRFKWLGLWVIRIWTRGQILLKK